MFDCIFIQTLKGIKSYIYAIRNGHISIDNTQIIPDFNEHIYSQEYIFERIEALVDYALNLYELGNK